MVCISSLYEKLILSHHLLLDSDIAAAVAHEHCKRTLSEGLRQPVLGEDPSRTFKTGSKNVQSEGEVSTGQKSRENCATFKSKPLPLPDARILPLAFGFEHVRKSICQGANL